jgi:hypothetical protein
MTNAAATSTTDDEVIDPEFTVTMKSYDIKTKCYFVQMIDVLITSGKSHRTSCAYAGLVPLYCHCWKGCSQRLTM